MRYLSTRGGAPALGFADVLLVGVATDGGLYVPASVPPLPADWDRPRPYAELATDVMWPYLGEGFIERDEFAHMVTEAYAGFEHPDVVPVREIEPGLHLAELFWGPTLAFKDLALQLVGRLFEYELARRGERVVDQGIGAGQRIPVRRAADGDTEVSAARRADAVHEARAGAGFDDADHWGTNRMRSPGMAQSACSVSDVSPMSRQPPGEALG